MDTVIDSLATWLPRMKSPFLFEIVISLLALLAFRFYNYKRPAQFPRVGIHPGLCGVRTRAAENEFYFHSHQLVSEGYARSKDSPFIIQTSDTERLVVPEKLVDELKNLPESCLSHKAALLTRFMGRYTSMDCVDGSDVHRNVCKVQLTYHLGALIERMLEEAQNGLREQLQGCGSQAWNAVPAFGLILNTVTRITSVVIVDEPVSRDIRWLKTILRYPSDVAILSMTLRRQLPLLRPFVYPFLSLKKELRRDISTATELLTPIINARRSAPAQTPPVDLLQWLLDESKGKNSDPEKIVRKILFLVVAAIHTSNMTAVHALYDLCAMPEYLDILRLEIYQALEMEGGWSLHTLHRLKKMDSFLKESQRINSPGLLSFNRLLKQDIKLSDGTVLPSGTMICRAASAASKDASKYPSPDIQQPLRYYTDEIAGAGKTTRNQFSSIASGDSWFGHGRQACPGRWYATAQIKLVLAILLLDYDFKYPDGETRPANVHADEKISPNTEQKLLFRRRE